MKAKVGIFFSSDTGNTENVAKMIQKQLGTNVADIFDIVNSNREDLEQYNNLLLGIPTWYYGEAQCDWEDFFPILKTINFCGKKVGIFGCGDQEDYAEYFCDAMNILKEITEHNGATLIGKWPTDGYRFESSKSLINKDHFVGLVIDEDRQPEMTLDRVINWVKQIKKEMNLN
ncbi:flavodoxin FldA [Blochmannia endosymbiont of Camponotus (Colobopsis) obliquus]|uniref:flavodoxin FldA n=1 Tax=Blochmannia endosymbiont of Camponotus (Colobopsis) obliquus TaxID=1505597 RepID=UPI00061A6339|nr:flavodoxin FldA [Blochmannia endosymbiont of Camponotus (Colobopsis) obliquus]AKC60488.1 Flavodoxin-1 [Blochmannia endosymbiont of Camponotus (Colobopsis) obliquus]